MVIQTLTLDCHDVPRACESLAAIFCVPAECIQEFIGGASAQDVESPSPWDWAGNLYARLLESVGPPREFHRTCWFHFTRLQPGVRFTDGLLPLVDSLPIILGLLRSLAEPHVGARDWASFEEAVLAGRVSGITLRDRQTSAYQQGPFGGLVRDFAFLASSKRDYFRRLPEATEDLIGEINGRFNVDLEPAYHDASSSYIVKFATPTASPKDIAAALYYLYCMYQGQGLDDCAITYCTRHGRAVPPEDIIEVEEFRPPPALILAA